MTLAAGFTLGEWVVRPADGSIVSGETSRRLEPLLMDLLVFLCSRAGQVVTKDDVLAHVWHGRFVSEDTLKASFYQLRRALDDSARAPRYVETLPKRGYRMLIDPVPLDSATRDRSPAAQALYSKGLTLLAAQPSASDLKQARLYFERVLEADPNYPDAAAMLALVYVHLVSVGSDEDLMARASSLVPRAGLRTYAGLMALGITSLLYERNVATAERSLREAVSLDTQDSAARRWLAKLLSFCGRHDEAIAEARHAAEADPLSMMAGRDLLEVLFMARRYDDALQQSHRLLSIAGSAPDVRLGLVWIHWMMGDQQKAFDTLYAGFSELGVAREVLDRLADTFRERGMRGVFDVWAEFLGQRSALGQSALDLLFLDAVLGRHDRAFRLIDVLLRRGHPALLWIPVCPLLDDLRSDVRYSGVRSQLRVGEAS